MKISELIDYLINMRKYQGNIEIFEARREYGYKEITEETLKTFIRRETETTKDETKEIWMIGRH